MKLGDIVNRAKKVVDSRGGTDALKEDLNELKDIAGSKGSVGDKAKRAADALKEPGHHDKAPEAEQSPASSPPPPAS